MAIGDQNFAKEVVDATLDTLRDQEDQVGQQIVQGKTTINPQVFQPIDNDVILKKLFDTPRHLIDQALADLKQTQQTTLTVGPITLEKKFQVLPEPFFGQMSSGLQPSQVNIVSQEVPFLVQPFIREWIWSNGMVDGFYLGLYALTRPPIGLTTHYISWMMIGQASRYSDQAVSESWTQSYDYEDSGFLTDDQTADGGDVTIEDVSDY